jgi:hypothetical protein
MVCLLLGAGPVGASVITFSEPGLLVGATLSTQLAPFGVIFSVTGGTALVGGPFVPPAGSTISGQYLMVNTCHYLASSCSGSPAVLSIFFVSPSDPNHKGYVDGSTIFLDLWDTNANPSPRVIVHAYDVFGTHLGTLNLLPEFANGLGGLTGNVHRLEIVDHGADGHVIDNLRYGPITPVPEPVSIMLTGLGLAGLGLYRRRAGGRLEAHITRFES